MQNPVNVLPYLHKLEIFEARHILLPIYSPDVDLPLVQTLRVLHLKSVSVQWMAGQIFPALEECSIISPHHADTIQSVYMPSCSILKYDSNNLGALEHFHTPRLGRSEVKCGQCRTSAGNQQLAALRPIFAVRSLTSLHLEIKCSERLLAYMLRLVPNLEELWMGLSSPHALSSAFFLALAAGGCNVKAGPSSQAIAPFGRKLRMLHLHYKRWFRGPERNALMPAFGAVVASRPPKGQIFSFRLRFDEGPESQEWNIHEPVERFDIGLEFKGIVIGFSSQDGVVPLSRVETDDPLGPREKSEYLPLPRESEHITTKASLVLPHNFLFSAHNLKEIRVYGSLLKMEPDTQLPLNTPLFHTLKVLVGCSISSSFLAGQTFNKLERYKEEWIFDKRIPEQGSLTDMPVCTRMVVPLFRLVTLRLPQIRELGVRIGREGNHIWKKHIAVNANLSGLKLLHLQHPFRAPPIAIVKILRLLPALETLVVDDQHLVASNINFFEAFLPLNLLGPSGLNRSSYEGQTSGVFCPRLESLQIEGVSLTEQAKLIRLLKDIVTQRATIGSPLKSFTFYFDRYPVDTPHKWQLIGREKSFMMEEVVPAKQFRLDI